MGIGTGHVDYDRDPNLPYERMRVREVAKRKGSSQMDWISLSEFFRADTLYHKSEPFFRAMSWHSRNKVHTPSHSKLSPL